MSNRRLTAEVLAPIAGLLLLGLPFPASADGNSIVSFTSTGHLSRSDVLEITELIQYDYAAGPVESYTRAIPVSYTDDQGAVYPIRFTLTKTSIDGKPVNVTPTQDGTNARVTFPAPTATKTPLYELRYTLAPVVVKGFGADVLRLSIFGGNTTVPIQQASYTLQTPGLKAKDYTCETLAQGQNTNKCVFTHAGETVVFTTNAPLITGESLTISGGFPHNTFSQYLKPDSPILNWIIFWSVGVLILATPIVIAVILGRRRRHQRQDKDRRGSNGA